MTPNQLENSRKSFCSRRVVVTGTGAVTPIGLDTKTFWQHLVDGVCGIRPFEGVRDQGLPIHVAATIDDFDPHAFMEKREARRMDRYCQLGVAAAQMAMQDSGLVVDDYGPYRVGTIIGSGVGGLETMAVEFGKLYGDVGARRISPLFVPMMIANMAAGKVSMIHNAKGSSLCVTTACASGTHAIGEAYRAIKHGYLDACISGGCEAPITPIAIAGFNNMKALTSATDPAKASLPFDQRRSGFVIGEGAGILILEELESAQKRGANILCELAGYGSTADAYHITSPDPEGEGPAEAMRLAMSDAEVLPQQVGYINAHGTSTPLNDKFETLAIHKALGESAKETAVSSSKSMLGHLLGAAGAVEAIASALALKDGILPPTIGLEEQDPECDLDYVPHRSRRQHVDVALSNSLGFGGHNGCLCLKRWED